MAIPPIHVVTDDEVVASPGFLRSARAVLHSGGIRLALHLRAPHASGREVWTLASALGRDAEEAGATLLVNDRVDVALLSGVRGVHLGRRSLRPSDARRLLGPARLIGASVHRVAEARAVAADVDFLLVGTMYATPSHPDEPGAGPGSLAEFADLGRPCIAIGGVTAGRIGELRAHGAAGIGVLRAVWSASDPAAALQELVGAWQKNTDHAKTPSG
jgi:thiamine-phosphate pyrophosphorylase